MGDVKIAHNIQHLSLGAHTIPQVDRLLMGQGEDWKSKKNQQKQQKKKYDALDDIGQTEGLTVQRSKNFPPRN